METRLSDFTREELKMAFVAIGLYQADNKEDEKINDMCERWMTQLAYAGGLKAFEDKVKSN